MRVRTRTVRIVSCICVIFWGVYHTSAQQQWLTVDQTPGLPSGYGQYQPKGFDTSYYETPPISDSISNDPSGLFNDTGKSCWGGFSRRCTLPVGGPSATQPSGNYVFDIPVMANYLIYVYLKYAANNGNNHLLLVKTNAGSVIADSLRFDGYAPGSDVPLFIKRGLLQTCDSTRDTAAGINIPDPGSDGAWLPLTCVPLTQGNDQVTVSWAADKLTENYFRFDAVRLLRTDAQRSLQYGRREKIGFVNSRRVPEMFPETIAGKPTTRSYKFWSLGSSPVTLTSISRGKSGFYCLTTLPVTIQPGTYKTIDIQFYPVAEGELLDTLTITSDDSNEPEARWVFIGTGIWYNFILNASSNGVEPHWNAPGSPSSADYSGAPYFNPIYSEQPSGWFNSAPNNAYRYPIGGGDASSRVYTGSGPCACSFKFMLPPEKSGIYTLEYLGPAGSTNAHENVLIEVITPFRSDTQHVTTSLRIPAGSLFTPLGGVGYFSLNGGDTTTIRFSAINTQTPPECLRMDLIRVRKKPTPIFPPHDPIVFPQISVNDSIRRSSDNYYKIIKIYNSVSGEMYLKSITLGKNTAFKFHTPPPPNIKIAAEGGFYDVRVDFLPDSIGLYIDTLIVRTDISADSLWRYILIGHGVGIQLIVDNSDTSSTYFRPQGIVPWDPLNSDAQKKWQRITGSGYHGDCLLGRIYKIGPAVVEWYPTIPILNGKTGDLINFNVGMKMLPGSMNSSPCVRYVVHEATGRVDTFIVNQNGISAPDSIIWLGNKQAFVFRRGGCDNQGVPTQFGFVALENDTAAVSHYYNDFGMRNIARDSGHYVRADAIVLEETQAAMSVGKTFGVAPPTAFELGQNYPNPFNPSTTISVSLPQSTNVSVIIYDILGREVVRLIDGEQKETGYYVLRWDATNKNGTMVASGVYFYRLKAGGFVLTKKMLLVR